jgi:hypothetical protein
MYFSQTETLRKYPPAPVLQRQCAKSTKIRGTDVIVEKGVQILVPILGLQHDPKYYPDPERFQPERFSDEEKKKRPQFCYLPFGEGPRICIGECNLSCPYTDHSTGDGRMSIPRFDTRRSSKRHSNSPHDQPCPGTHTKSNRMLPLSIGGVNSASGSVNQNLRGLQYADPHIHTISRSS